MKPLDSETYTPDEHVPPTKYQVQFARKIGLVVQPAEMSREELRRLISAKLINDHHIFADACFSTAYGVCRIVQVRLGSSNVTVRVDGEDRNRGIDIKFLLNGTYLPSPTVLTR